MLNHIPWLLRYLPIFRNWLITSDIAFHLFPVVALENDWSHLLNLAVGEVLSWLDIACQVVVFGNP